VIQFWQRAILGQRGVARVHVCERRHMARGA